MFSCSYSTGKQYNCKIKRIFKKNITTQTNIKDDLLKLKYKAHKVGFTELEDVIAERMEYSDKVIDAVNSRVIRKEQQDSRAKGPFHLEGDLADRL